jgi:transcriptional regulator with XRE-family HTH domain
MSEQRRAQIRQIRGILGLSAAEAGQLLGVTEKAWQHWESGIRNMPDTKYQLFLTKVGNQINNTDPHCDLIVVYLYDNEGYPSPIGSLSNLNYLSHVYSEDGKSMCVDSLILDLKANLRRRNRICFNIKDNVHAKRAVERWANSVKDEFDFNVGERWL